MQTSAWLGIMGLLLFLAAGNWHWAQAWAFLAIFAVGSLAFSVWLLRRDPALPASLVQPVDGELRFIVDRAAIGG